MLYAEYFNGNGYDTFFQISLFPNKIFSKEFLKRHKCANHLRSKSEDSEGV